MYTQRTTVILLCLLEVFIHNGARALCVWPSAFTSTVWHDSVNGDMTFGTSDMTGYKFHLNDTHNINQWNCHDVTTFSTDGKVLFLSVNSFTMFSTTFYAYICLTMTKITDASYRYYISYPTDSNVLNQRVHIYPVNTLTDRNAICNDLTGASDGEYQMLIKSGQESTAKIKCPWSLLARYGYTHTTFGGTTTCNGDPTSMNICSDNTQTTFNYTACSTKVLYSDSDTVWCVANVVSGATNYLTVYNGNDAAGTIDNSNVFRYACICMDNNGTEASISPRHCWVGQVPDQFPTDSSGASLGARITIINTTETCPTCPNLSAPALGNVSVTTTDTVTTGLYTCSTGYALHGTNERTCQTDDTWSSSAPYCSCATPSSPSSGTVTVNTEGTVATYTCNVGYTISGPTSRTCDVTGPTWNGTDPTCVQCESLVDGPGRSYLLATDTTTTQATYSCSARYTLTGTRTIQCLSNGTWEVEQPTCVTCAALTHPQSGQASISTDGVTSVVDYTCNSGYYLVGAAYRVCDQTGTWNGTQPTCACLTPSTPSNGGVAADGSTATYTCDLNYSLNGDVTRTCQTDGSGWSGVDPACTSCNSLSAVVGGSYMTSTTGTVTSATYMCNQGYSLSGVSPITCSDAGSWGTEPNCVECQTLTSPSSGLVQLSTSGTRTSATYSCTSGYNLLGVTVRLCNSDGTWTLTSPTCSCQDPISPLNGVVVSDGSTATYTCSNGYTLNGVTERTCGTDGSGWTSSDPTCSTCATLTTPSGGNVTLNTDGETTLATYMCDVRYTLNGVSPITCRSDGTWDFSQPNCAQCPSLTTPTSGSVDVTSDGTTTTAAFSCASAYYLSGSATLTCKSTGAWSNSEPVCKCNFPSTPSNGGVSVTDGSSGTVATHTCDAWYTLSGLSSRLCMPDGTGWEGADPSCVGCTTLTLPTGGTFSIVTNGTNSAASFTCTVGTSLLGEEELTCQSTGLWDHSVPSCVSCPTLADPDSGSVALATSGTITQATFSCVSGYQLLGAATLSCVASTGAWDLTAPTCICTSPPLLVNGVMTRDPATSSTVSYTCDTGYVLTGSDTRTCQNDGTGWDGIQPSCELVAVGESTEDTSIMSVPIAVVAVLCLLVVILLILVIIFVCLYISKNKVMNKAECTTLIPPSGAGISLSSTGLTTVSNYSCQTGYTISGTSQQTCQTDTSWLPVAPSCTQCVTLNNPTSGTVTLTTDGHVTTALFTCMSGYSRVGVDERTCQVDGSWDAASPICRCDDPATPSDGAVTADGSTATYTCNQGYTLSGSVSRTCTTDGSGWSDTDPSCALCSTLANPTGGSFTQATTGSQTFATLTCHQGYTLSGNVKVNCISDGSWETQPTCVECAALAAPDSGSVALSSDGNITTATYSCNTNYDLVGNSGRTCTTSGTWTLSAPTCVCVNPSAPSNGAVSADTATATYTCDVGYSLDGSSTRTCNADGTWWSGADPICAPCATLNSPTGGSVSMATDGLETTASFICSVGYTLNGEKTIACRNDGTWDFSQPACVSCPTLADPASGSISMTTDNYITTASFACEPAYFINGALSVTCRTDGTWSTSSPVCKCTFPVAPDQGAVSVTDYASGQVASYQCNHGYSMNGLSSRQCLSDGTGWEGADPTCVQCSTVTTPANLQFTTQTNGTNTLGHYTCSVNYTLDGTASQVCQSDGSWTDTMPTCVSCPTKSHPDSGSVVLSTDGQETIATFSCSTGYGLNSTAVLTCETSGTWDLQDPSCVCLNPANVADGTVVVYEDNNIQIANYTCNDNFELIGPSQRVCRTAGLGWNGTQPRCEPVVIIPPDTGASQDVTELTISIGLLIALLVVIVILAALVGFCWYKKCRSDSQKVSSTEEATSEQPSFERGHDLENGTATLITDKESKSTFNVNKLNPNIFYTTPPADVAGSRPPTIIKLPKLPVMTEPETNRPSRFVHPPPKMPGPETNKPVSVIRLPGSVTLPGSSIEPEGNTPLTAVRLPKIDSLPPESHETPRSPHKKSKKKDRHKNRSSKEKKKKETPRMSTPKEGSLPEDEASNFLAGENFDYIRPIYTPKVSRPTTATSISLRAASSNSMVTGKSPYQQKLT